MFYNVIKGEEIMANSYLKELAKKAKNRLKTVGEAIEANKQAKTKTAALSNHEYAIIATRVKIEDDPLYNKVVKLLAKDPDICNPIGQLINRKEFNELSETGKQRYILNLSTRFNKIKNKLLASDMV